eukprot:CAMPEP_0118697444 /NCGR_PEP_ID=MMETSP0800-20121206/14509_1 /TAXON_ID=210618 ORGANISM="Striatella unipunctata, Strain CCMP2910" /NCGR_SAMPLE_ID=MMETSP0800 /ASSEMBLY_ACC=CAM_ASM_000638 /LENGTH=66 /DNA_ID=CAMNT_0006596875 /DNA_START=296 /DNA_END=493 /DNA_ORIENTATION=-
MPTAQQIDSKTNCNYPPASLVNMCDEVVIVIFKGNAPTMESQALNIRDEAHWQEKEKHRKQNKSVA